MLGLVKLLTGQRLRMRFVNMLLQKFQKLQKVFLSEAEGAQRLQMTERERRPIKERTLGTLQSGSVELVAKP